MKILFCSDGSAVAEQAVAFGACVAAGSRAEVTLLGVSEVTVAENTLQTSLRRSQELLKRHGVNAEIIAKTGRPLSEIVQRSRATVYDLVVLGAERRQGGRPLLGSAGAYDVIEAITPPVLLHVGQLRPLQNILLCTGGGEQSSKTVELTGTIARSSGAVVTLFHVLAAPPVLYAHLLKQEDDARQVLASDSSLGRGLREEQARLKELGVQCQVRLRHGQVVPELLTELQQVQYDLVVTGSSPARDPLRAYMLGNVTREVIKHATWPVLVVRTGTLPRRWSRFVSGLFSGAQPPPETPPC